MLSSEERVFSVIFPHPPWGPLTYRGAAPPGGVVFVPLKHRVTVGVVWEEEPQVPEREIRPVAGFTGAVLPSWVLTALRRLAARTGHPPGKFLSHALPPGMEDLYHLQIRPRELPLRVPGVRRRLLEALSDRRWRAWKRLRQTTRATARDLLRLLEAGAIEIRERYPLWKEKAHSPPSSSSSLRMLYGLTLGEKRRLLHAWAPERPVMFWVADPSLARFWGHLLHWPVYSSATPPGMRRKLWEEALAGKVSGVVITRAGFLLPLPRPVLVVDEPWMEGFFFRTDLTLEAVLSSLPLPIRVFRSAPALPGEGSWPDVRVARRFPERSPRWKVGSRPHFLWRAVERALERGHNLAFWVGQKGFGFLRCQVCGWRARCPRDNVSLVLFRYPAPRLLCPRCGQESSPPLRCPTCGSEDLSARGKGLEAVAEEVKHRFPEARVITLTARPDNPAALRRLLLLWERGGADVLIGTWAARTAFVHPVTRWFVAWYPEGTLRSRKDEWRLALRLSWLSWMREEGRILLTARKDLPLFHHLARGSLRRYFERVYRET